MTFQVKEKNQVKRMKRLITCHDKILFGVFIKYCFNGVRGLEHIDWDRVSKSWNKRQLTKSFFQKSDNEKMREMEK